MFLFYLKSSFCSQDISVFVLNFWSYRKTTWLERLGLGIMLHSFFEKHKICLNRTETLLILIVNSSNIMSKSSEDFVMERHSVI